MNPHAPDDTELTAYALGELPPEQERDMRAWIATNAEAQSELTRIEHITEALHHSAPIPTAKLTVQQRQSVLTPPKGPRIVTPMMPRQPVVRRHSRVLPFLIGVTKIAAVLALAAGAYFMGRHASSEGTPQMATHAVPQGRKLPMPQTNVVPLKSTPVKTVATATAEPVMEPATIRAEKNLPTPVPDIKAVATIETEPKEEGKNLAVVNLAKSTPAAVSNDARGYTSVSREPVSRVTICPHETRPAAVKPGGPMLASPLPQAPAPQGGASDKGRAPDLFIQSWKAEVASCPWNGNHKLMRVLVQLPADQPASVSSANTYPLQVSFDQLTVRGYRLLSESHVPPHPGTNAAAHVMWYELIPNGTVSETNRETGRPVATITVPSARFNSQTIGPFDGSKLQVLDRGVKWENAREDFLFETSIVGFGLLLRGEENLGSLDHELVLKIAGKAQGDRATEGERAKFIKLVQEARRVTGI